MDIEKHMCMRAKKIKAFNPTKPLLLSFADVRGVFRAIERLVIALWRREM